MHHNIHPKSTRKLKRQEKLKNSTITIRQNSVTLMTKNTYCTHDPKYQSYLDKMQANSWCCTCSSNGSSVSRNLPRCQRQFISMSVTKGSCHVQPNSKKAATWMGQFTNLMSSSHVIVYLHCWIIWIDRSCKQVVVWLAVLCTPISWCQVPKWF